KAGFLFKDAASRDAFVRDAFTDSGTRFSLRDSEAPQSIGKARTEKVVRDTLGNEASNVMVVDNYADLHADLRAVLEADGMTPDGFTAVQYKGKSYIQAQYINSEARAQEVVFHEHFAHVGLRRMYGSELGPKL